jgi:hypothetical protein
MTACWPPFLNLAFIPILYVVVKSIGRKRQS